MARENRWLPAGAEAYIPTSGLGKHYYLAFDLTLGSTWTAIGSDPTPFTGTLDGRRHTITVSGTTTVTHTGSSYSATAGLFGYIYGGTVENLTLTGGTFTATVDPTGISMGGIAGVLEAGTIENCAVEVYIIQNNPLAGSARVGGIAGYNYGAIRNCYSSGNVTVIFGSSTYVGGIAGSNYNHSVNSGTIQNCYSTGDISGKTTYDQVAYVGGIAGASDSDTVSYCYAAGDITGESYTGNSFCGGIVGSSIYLTNIDHCVALNGNITKDGSTRIGRVSGYSSSSGTDPNYGRDNMQMNSTTHSWTNSTANIDGGDVTMTQANTSGWWTSPAGWTINPTVAAATNTNPWIWGTNLPKLYWE
jgi:hypothetical protein